MTSTITAVFSAFSFFGLAIVSVWFASERTIFSRHKGRKWVADVLDDVSIPGYKRVKGIALDLSQSARVVRIPPIPLGRMGVWFSRSPVGTGRTDSVELIPPPYGSSTIPPGMGVITPRSNPVSPTRSIVQFQPGHEGGSYSGASGRPADASPVASLTIHPPSSPEPGPEISSIRDRFRSLVRCTVLVNRLI